MRILSVVVALFALVLSVVPGGATTPYLTEEEVQADARRGFEELLDLWRDGKYDEVYERTIIGGKLTKEEFVARLHAAPLHPACCWQKLQDVRITVKGDGAVVLRAKVGFDWFGSTLYKTKAFKLVKEEGVWRIAQAEILTLGGATKGKGGRATRKGR